MKTKIVRKIVHIDEEKCNGCGACTDKCAEGALKIIDGKARLMSETYCDGLGACLGECPQGAITIEERPAAEFSEEAVKHHLKEAEETIPCGCSSATVQEFGHKEPGKESPRGEVKSSLGHWPVQLTLVPPQAPFLKNADIVLVADCVPFAYPKLHEDFLAGHAVSSGLSQVGRFRCPPGKADTGSSGGETEKPDGSPHGSTLLLGANAYGQAGDSRQRGKTAG